jgi:hypothetical protein
MRPHDKNAPTRDVFAKMSDIVDTHEQKIVIPSSGWLSAGDIRLTVSRRLFSWLSLCIRWNIPQFTLLLLWCCGITQHMKNDWQIFVRLWNSTISCIGRRRFLGNNPFVVNPSWRWTYILPIMSFIGSSSGLSDRSRDTRLAISRPGAICVSWAGWLREIFSYSN